MLPLKSGFGWASRNALGSRRWAPASSPRASPFDQQSFAEHPHKRRGYERQMRGMR